MTPEEDTQPGESQPENGGDLPGDAVVQEPEATAEPVQTPAQEAADGAEEPSVDGETPPTETAAPADVPEATEEPEVTEEAEEAPSAGTPFGEGMLAFDSEEEALAYLWSLEDDEYGVMPVLEANNEKVDPQYFRFATYGANESGTPTTYANYSALQGAFPSIGTWSGPDGGDVQGEDTAAVDKVLATYPQVPGYKISSIRVNETRIYHLGMYDVNGKKYVHFSAINAQGRMTTAVLTNETYDTPPFQVRYVPAEYTITYEVYLDSAKQDDGNETFGLNAIFGGNRATTTVDNWASVDVTIPAGYIGRVYIGNTSGFTANDDSQKFPNEASYGRYPLGAEPEYTYNEDTNTITPVSDSDSPGSYTLTGTYSVGSSGDEVSADQTVRVVLTKKESITFHAEAWKLYQVGDTTTAHKVSIGGTSGETVSDDSWKVTSSLDTGTFTWTFAVQSYYDANGISAEHYITDAELRTLEINGASITVPFVSNTTLTSEEETTLPSGAEVNIQAAYNGGNPQYTITVTGATRNIWITGGSMNTNDSTYKELIMSGLYGVTVELWANDNGGGDWIEVAAGDTFCTGYTWGNYEQQNAYGDAGFLYHMTGTVRDTTGTYSGNVRFQLQDGFTFAGGDTNSGGQEDRPTVQLVNKNGVVISSSVGGTALTVSGPDGEGWYYVTLPSPYGTTEAAARNETMNAYLLEVRAYPRQYVVVYQDGVTADTGGALNPQITPEMVDTVNGMPDYHDSNGLDDTLFLCRQ